MDILLFVVSGLFLFIGLLGCILPVVPGPPLSYIGLLLLQLTSPTPFTVRFMLIWAGITVLVTVLDFVIPALGAKKYGGSRYGVLGAMLGLLVGLFVFPPIGIIIGPVVGAFAGEYLYGKSHKEARRAAFGSFVGYLVTTMIKLAASSMMIYYFVIEIF